MNTKGRDRKRIAKKSNTLKVNGVNGIVGSRSKVTRVIKKVNGHSYMVSKVSSATMAKMPVKTVTFIELNPLSTLLRHFRRFKLIDD